MREGWRHLFELFLVSLRASDTEEAIQTPIGNLTFTQSPETPKKRVPRARPRLGKR